MLHKIYGFPSLNIFSIFVFVYYADHVIFIICISSRWEKQAKKKESQPNYFNIRKPHWNIIFFDDLWILGLVKNNLNQLVILLSSSFFVSSKALMSLCGNKRFLSFVKMVGFGTFEEWCRSFKYNRNNKGPNIDPWGRSHAFVALLVELRSKEINYFWFFK